MSKHLVNEHPKDFERYKCEEKSKGDGMEAGMQPCKKRQKCHHGVFCSNTCYKKGDLAQVRFHEDLVFYIAKGYITLFAVESSWLQRLLYGRMARSDFPQGGPLRGSNF